MDPHQALPQVAGRQPEERVNSGSLDAFAQHGVAAIDLRLGFPVDDQIAAVLRRNTLGPLGIKLWAAAAR